MFQNMRGQRVAHMLCAVANEGISVEKSDKAMLEAYVLGNVSGHDLLTHASQFKTLSSYEEWLNTSPNGRSGDKVSPVSVEQIVDQVKAYITRKHRESYEVACDV